jgi:hypothetical protein
MAIDEIIEMCNSESHNITDVLRMAVLKELAGSGFDDKDWYTFQRAVCDAYGAQHCFTLENFERAGLLHNRAVNKWFNRARIRWDLIVPTDFATPTDFSFTYNRYAMARLCKPTIESHAIDCTIASYAPLSVRLIQLLSSDEDIKGVIDIIPSPTFFTSADGKSHIAPSLISSAPPSSSSHAPPPPTTAYQPPPPPPPPLTLASYGVRGAASTSDLATSAARLATSGMNTLASTATTATTAAFGALKDMAKIDVKGLLDIPQDLGAPSKSTLRTLVFYVGGITRAEIAAIRWLNDHGLGKYIIGTTSIISGTQLMESMITVPTLPF